jgi:hypothetical protein
MWFNVYLPQLPTHDADSGYTAPLVNNIETDYMPTVSQFISTMSGNGLFAILISASYSEILFGTSYTSPMKVVRVLRMWLFLSLIGFAMFPSFNKEHFGSKPNDTIHSIVAVSFSLASYVYIFSECWHGVTGGHSLASMSTAHSKKWFLGISIANACCIVAIAIAFLHMSAENHLIHPLEFWFFECLNLTMMTIWPRFLTLRDVEVATFQIDQL